VAQETNEDVAEVVPSEPAPKSEPAPEKPHRVVRRFPKWFDPPTRIEEMRF
jgi:hypothetical protein